MTKSLEAVGLALLLAGCAAMAPRDEPRTSSTAPRAAATPGTAIDGRARASEHVTPSADVRFDAGSAELDRAATARLDDLLAIAPRYDIEAVLVVGFADAGEPSADRQSLSERRAARVARYLVDHGIDAALVRSSARGDRDPIAAVMRDGRDDPAARAKNRRVEIELVGRPKDRRPPRPGDPVD